MCITYSLFWIAEINTTLYINYTPVKINYKKNHPPQKGTFFSYKQEYDFISFFDFQLKPTHTHARVRTHTHSHKHIYYDASFFYQPPLPQAWRRKWQATPIFLPGKSQDRGTWWVTVMGSQRVGHDWVTNTHTHTHTHSLDISFCIRLEDGFI